MRERGRGGERHRDRGGERYIQCVGDRYLQGERGGERDTVCEREREREKGK